MLRYSHGFYRDSKVNGISGGHGSMYDDTGRPCVMVSGGWRSVGDAGALECQEEEPD